MVRTTTWSPGSPAGEEVRGVCRAAHSRAALIFYYLDSSAWMKRYYQEHGSERVAELFDQQETMACATLGVIEIAATLARKR